MPKTSGLEKQLIQSQRAVKNGIKQPLDGEEPFRAMAEVHRQYSVRHWMHNVMLGTTKGLLREAEPQPPQKPKPPPTPLVRRMGKGMPKPVPFAVYRLIHEVGTGLINSKYYSGKTTVAMGLVASIATGKPFAGRKVLRRGAVLWLAAEGAWEVDKRIRAAVTALGCDPDEQPVYVQTGSVPKLLAERGEQAVMEIVSRQSKWPRKNLGCLGFIVFDTMIKSAGYKKE